MERDLPLTPDGAAPYYRILTGADYAIITMTTPLHRGLRHVALRVTNLAKSRQFYQELLGMKVVWEPDADNIYFSSGPDNLALHQIAPDDLASYQPPSKDNQLLDHVGVILPTAEAVDRMYEDVAPKIQSLGGVVVKQPKRHRDGSYSFYFSDPDGNVIQALYEPTISHLQWRGD
jgi:catechol 2,3-dioxygenase-like lactoylglutathione lyase family enzyme